MKRLILLMIFIVSILSASDVKIGLNTMNIQDSEGSGIALFYKIKDNLLLETSYNEAYIRGVKKDNQNETWNKFNTQRLGIRYYLQSYSQDKIKLFLSLGLEHIYKNKKLSSNTPKLNTYGLLGLDFSINKYFDISFALGSSGKGEKANKLKTNPNYAHGFNVLVGVELKLF